MIDLAKLLGILFALLSWFGLLSCFDSISQTRSHLDCIIGSLLFYSTLEQIYLFFLNRSHTSFGTDIHFTDTVKQNI